MKPTCSYDQCTKPVRARALCRGHIGQLERGQTLHPLRRRSPARLPLAEKMASFTTKTDGCWHWNSATVQGGYGQLRTEDGTNRLAHRVAYELAYGPIPEGRDIDHKCHNRGCVNPEHLQAVTKSENMQNYKGARAVSRTGIRGVMPRDGKFVVEVRHLDKRYFAGPFETVEEAERSAIEIRNRVFTNNLVDRGLNI